MPNNQFARYLTAKRTVDDRALNRNVWEELARTVQARQTLLTRPLRVLELGAGVGTMVERALAWKLFSGAERVEYTLLDADVELKEAARQRLSEVPDWLRIEFVAANALEYAADLSADPQAPRCDLLIANAFLDLLDLRTALPLLRGLPGDGGLFYFTINFDGATLLEPTIDPVFDRTIETAYHQTMDERIVDGSPSGDSRTGRHLFELLPAAGFEIHAAGSSDWVVFPVRGVYPADEAFFLHFIVETMHGALTGHPTLPVEQFATWIDLRHRQVDAGKLTYIAHQLDFFGTAARTQ